MRRGNKLQKKVTEGATTKTTDYLGGMIFENNVLQHVATEEGRIRPNGTGFVYDYFLKDHLGNIPAMVQEDKTLLEETHYYPFGLIQRGITLQAAGALANKDKTFQGQKFDDDLGLNYYSFKYRNHDPQIGRFIQIDPLSDKYSNNSNYAFAENKVTLGIDLEGLELLPFNTAWFRIFAQSSTNPHYNQKEWKEYVSVVAANVPKVFKDPSGSLLFTANSVDVGIHGKILKGNESGKFFMQGNRLPKVPGWAWGTGDPEPTGNVGGWKMGYNLGDNKAFADRASAIAGAPQEIYNFYDTYQNRVPIWNAYSELGQNQNSFDNAVRLAGNIGLNVVEQSPNPSLRDGVINFLNDGSLPSLNLKDMKGSLQNGISIMRAGIGIMNANGIQVQSNVTQQY